MHAEEFLTRPREINKEIRRQEAIADEIRNSLEPQAIRYDRDKVQTSPVDPVPNMIARLDEKLTEIERLKECRYCAMLEIDRVLSLLDDQDERTVLTHWYLMDECEEDVLEAAMCSMRTMYRIKQRGLQHVEEILMKVGSEWQ
ncbi:MAG: hypothetical protein ACOX4I_00760 [Anaerovoracaceae bacterium]